MALGSPSTSSVAKLVYWSGADAGHSPSTSSASHTEDAYFENTGANESDENGKSMYVTLFEDMLKTVLSGEGKLFLKEELDCFMAWHRLPYGAKYLFCRLCLRKTDKWHRLTSLNYRAELGDAGILAAVQTLCGHAQDEDVKPKLEDLSVNMPDILPASHFGGGVKPKIEELEPVIPPEDLKPPGPGTVDLITDDDEPPKAGPSRPSPIYDPLSSSLTLSQGSRTSDYSVFADDEEQADIFELLDCLNAQELEDLAKQLKLKPRSKKRDVLIDAILRGSASQSTLPFAKSSAKGKEPMVQTKLLFDMKKAQQSLVQTRLPFKPTPEAQQTQRERVRVMVVQKLEKCIRLNADVVALFRRANLVYFRSTQHTQDLLTPAVLARARKRAYASYLHQRTPDIWPTREALLAYEEALMIEAEVDALLESSSSGSTSSWGERSTASRTPAPLVGSRFKTPITPGRASRASRSPIVAKSEAGGAGKDESMRVRNARKVKQILETVHPRWIELVQARGDEHPRREGLERFDCGHILTRVVAKGAYALGILKEYHEELRVLESLLAQTRWRRGRRGRWYERCALVLMTHLKDEEGCTEEAMNVVVAALKDPDTHIVFRPMLERRLTRLEKKLKLPPEECHVCAGGLKAATEVYVEGVRVHHRADSLMLDQAGRVVDKTPVKTQGLSWSNRREPSPKRPKEEKLEKNSGKSIWRGRESEEVTVEVYALQHYEDNHGCRGFHCEGRIVTTLFGLLFWDAIFAPIPGAFETPYQSAPLDLVEDTFYYSRQELADARIAEIEDGRAAEILEQAYDANRDVMCVGVRWDLFEKEDLLGIVKCLDPSALVAICRLMCEDYAGRTSGVPDLIVWNAEEGYARFVEVKGPGDTLQENQKVWINVLLQAGMPVEVCHVYEKGDTPKMRGKGKTPKKGKATGGQKRKRDDWLVESEDEELDYSQLDKQREDEAEVEAEASPTKKRKMRAATEVVLESPTAGKVARVSSQVEVVITSSPPSRSGGSSPTKRKRWSVGD